jgi:hypothetical protein
MMTAGRPSSQLSPTYTRAWTARIPRTRFTIIPSSVNTFPCHSTRITRDAGTVSRLPGLRIARPLVTPSGVRPISAARYRASSWDRSMRTSWSSV